jgi:hypothetical protein
MNVLPFTGWAHPKKGTIKKLIHPEDRAYCSEILYFTSYINKTDHI